MGIVVAEAGFRLSGIEPRPLQRTADSGRLNTRWVWLAALRGMA
jgi:hypothetical protein